jgi:hypothetical protein
VEGEGGRGWKEEDEETSAVAGEVVTVIVGGGRRGGEGVERLGVGESWPGVLNRSQCIL